MARESRHVDVAWAPFFFLLVVRRFMHHSLPALAIDRLSIISQRQL